MYAVCLLLPLQVKSGGTYNVVAFYTSDVAATVKLSVGPYAAIQNNSAASVTVQLPAQELVSKG
jgi:hypothetical protein